MHNNTTARKIDGEDETGMCFMSRPLKTKEKIFIHVAEIHAYWSSSLHVGLTNEAPDSILENASDLRIRASNKPLRFLPNHNDVLCFSLKQNGDLPVLTISVNDNEQQDIDLIYVSSSEPVWLVFELHGKAQAITISNKQMKKMPRHSCFSEF